MAVAPAAPTSTSICSGVTKWALLSVIFGSIAVVTIGTALANRGSSAPTGLTRAYITFERDGNDRGSLPQWLGKIHKHRHNKDKDISRGQGDGQQHRIPVRDGSESDLTLISNEGDSDSGVVSGLGLANGASMQVATSMASRIDREVEWLHEENQVMLNLSLRLEQNKFDASEVKKLEAQMKNVSEIEKEKLKQLETLLVLQDKQIREFFSRPHHQNVSTDGPPRAINAAKPVVVVQSPTYRPTTGAPTRSPSQSTAAPTNKPTSLPSIHFIPQPLGLDDVAFAVIGDRNRLYTWQLIPPKLHIIKTATKQPYNFLVALRMLKREHPDTKWYVVVDDDVFFFVGNLLKQLESLDSRKPYLIGSHNCQGPSFTGQHRQRVKASGYKGWIHGGPGVVYSHGLVAKMNVDCCITFYSNSRNWPWRAVDDVVATSCAMDYWPQGYITHFPGFFPQPPGSRSNDHRCECRIRPPRCTYRRKEILARPELQISYHHVNSQHCMNLFVGEVKRLEKQGFKDVLVSNETALLRLNNNRRVMQKPTDLACSL